MGNKHARDVVEEEERSSKRQRGSAAAAAAAAAPVRTFTSPAEECVSWIREQVVLFDSSSSTLTSREHMDQQLGYWVHNVPYSLEDDPLLFTRTYFAGVDDGAVPQAGQKKPPSFHHLVREAGQVPQLFHHRPVPTGDIQASKKYYKNGRHFYFIKNRVEQVPRSLTVVLPQWCETLPGLLPYAWHPLYQLICKSFRTSSLFGYLQPSVVCTKLGSKLAKSLIKIAATRIFADPEQSIIELPVNSVDSYNPGSQVGKFGMGFFSILYWLLGHPARYLTIESYNNNTHFVCVLQERAGELQFQLQVGNSNVYQNGVILTLHCHDDLFTAHNVAQFNNQLKKLEFLPSALIAVRQSDVEPFHALGPYMNLQHPNVVYVQVGSTGVKVEDFAQGMSLEVLLQKLFIPSVSSKTIEASLRDDGSSSAAAAAAHHQTRVIPGATHNRFVILVRSVAVVTLPFVNDTAVKYEIVLELPGSTSIPVSRDDVIITSRTQAELERELEELERQCLALKTIYPLQQALEAYSRYTPQTDNQKLMASYIARLQTNLLAGKIGVDWKYYAMLQWLDTENIMVEAQHSNLTALEAYLGPSDRKAPPDSKQPSQQYFANIFVKKKVYIVPRVPTTVTSADLPSFLFVDSGYVSKYAARWFTILPTVFLEQKLVCVDNVKEAVLLDSHYTDMVQQEFEAQVWYPERVSVLKKEQLCNMCYQLILKVEAVLKLSVNRRDLRHQNVHLGIDECNNAYGQPCEVNSVLDLLRYIIRELMILYNFSHGKTVKYMYSLYSKFDEIYRHQFPVVYGSDNVVHLHLHFQELRTVEYTKEYFKSWSQNKVLVNALFDWAHLVLEQIEYHPDAMFGYNVDLYMWTRNSPLYVITSASPILDAPQVVKSFNDNLILQLQVNQVSVEQFYVMQMLLLSYVLIKQYPTATSLISFRKTYYKKEHIFLRGTTHGTEEQTDLDVLYAHTGFNGLYMFLLQFIEDTFKNFKEFVDDTCAVYFFNVQNPDPFLRKFMVALETVVREYKQAESTTFLRLVPGDIPELDARLPVFTFTESQLITHVLKEDFDDTNPSTLFPVVAGTPSNRLEVQLTELAINEGSTKTFLNAVLTETLQNSIDAIRVFHPVDNRLLLYLKESDTHFVYQITDFVGMTFEAIVSVMIPFLSSKTPSEYVTGEMGSGFFNVYRESDRVVIDTVKGTRRTLLVDVPVRDSHDRVVNIERHVQMSEGRGSGNQTSIYVFIPKPVRVTALTNFVYFVTHVAGLLDMAPNVRFNNQPLTVTTTPLLESDTGEFVAQWITSGKQESYLFTKGVPFMPLYEYVLNQVPELPAYLLPELRYNLVINIAHGAYTPVQTRAKINVAVDVKIRFRKFLLNAVYLLLLNKCSNSVTEEEKNYYMRNYTSDSYLSQVVSRYDQEMPLNLMKTLTDFVLNYPYPGTRTSLNNSLTRAYWTMSSFKWENLFPEQTDKIKEQFPNPLLRALGVGWLSTKNRGPRPRERTKEETEALNMQEHLREPEREEAIQKLERVLNVFVTEFFKLGATLQIQGFEKTRSPPAVVLAHLDGGLLGLYTTLNNTITLQKRNFVTSEVLQFLEFCKTNTKNYWTPILNNDVYKICFENVGNSNNPTLIHELEHFRRRSSHLTFSNPHGPTTQIFSADDQESYEFEQGAKAVYNKILEADLTHTFFVAVKALLT